MGACEDWRRNSQERAALFQVLIAPLCMMQFRAYPSLSRVEYLLEEAENLSSAPPARHILL